MKKKPRMVYRDVSNSCAFMFSSICIDPGTFFFIKTKRETEGTGFNTNFNKEFHFILFIFVVYFVQCWRQLRSPIQVQRSYLRVRWSALGATSYLSGSQYWFIWTLLLKIWYFLCCFWHWQLIFVYLHYMTFDAIANCLAYIKTAQLKINLKFLKPIWCK